MIFDEKALKNCMAPSTNAALYPRVYLSIDNCFASKRWTAPEDWMRILDQLGLRYVEASADNECDPLYSTKDFLLDWARQVRSASAKYGVTVSQFYSGHGTYSTIGLSHTDERVRRHMLENWMKPMCQMAGSFGAYLGFFCHALPEAVLQDPQQYEAALATLYENLSAIAQMAKQSGCAGAAVETMYSPHQPPWTLESAEKLLRQVNALSETPFYLSVDVGHQSGQQRFLRPDRGMIAKCLLGEASPQERQALWLGPEGARQRYQEAENNMRSACAIGVIGGEAGEKKAGDKKARGRETLAASQAEAVEASFGEYPYLFASPQDGSYESWLEGFGKYSAIIHLQQTDGVSSPHWPFTPEHNGKGIVTGEKVLAALRRSYEGQEAPGMPPPVPDIYLTLEVFSGTGQRAHELLPWLQQSVAYWRRFIPQDGMPLDQLTE